MNADDDDARLVAFIDGQLDEQERRALEARLAGDADLRARLAEMRDGDRPFAPAFETLLGAAPIERLKARLAAILSDERAQGAPRWRLSLRARGVGAAAALALFCAGIAVGWIGPTQLARLFQTETSGEPDEDWRQAVAEYMALYTPDTFSTASGAPGAGLAAVGAKVGLNLTPERVALADMAFKGAQIFEFHGNPLGQLGYVDPTAGPVLFCIIRDAEAEAALKTEKRGGFSASSWARGGRGYMLIGRLPVDQIAALADSLARRF